LHATLFYLRIVGHIRKIIPYYYVPVKNRIKLKPRDIPEEFACYTLSDLVEQVTDGMQNAGWF